MWAKIFFPKWYQNNVVFFKMLIFSQLCVSHYFKKWFKKSLFSRNVDIFGYMDKKRLFQSDLEITLLSSKCWYFQDDLKTSTFFLNYIFEDMGKNYLIFFLNFDTIFAKWSLKTFFSSKCLFFGVFGKKLFLKVLSKYNYFPWNLN